MDPLANKYILIKENEESEKEQILRGLDSFNTQELQTMALISKLAPGVEQHINNIYAALNSYEVYVNNNRDKLRAALDYIDKRYDATGEFPTEEAEEFQMMVAGFPDNLREMIRDLNFDV